jgi:hypothetical protein
MLRLIMYGMCDCTSFSTTLVNILITEVGKTQSRDLNPRPAT